MTFAKKHIKYAVSTKRRPPMRSQYVIISPHFVDSDNWKDYGYWNRYGEWCYTTSNGYEYCSTTSNPNHYDPGNYRHSNIWNNNAYDRYMYGNLEHSHVHSHEDEYGYEYSHKHSHHHVSGYNHHK